MAELVLRSSGAELAGQEAGEGPAVVLLHGLTATRRYVVMGSRALERSAHRVIAYDARGHGRSSPAQHPGAYRYAELSADLEAVLDGLRIDRAVLAGASMGAHTAVRFALRRPDRVSGLVLITPAYEPGQESSAARLERWDALAAGLRGGGIEGFVAASGVPPGAPALRDTIVRVMRQRMAAHEHPEAVADALQLVPRSVPFGSLEELAAITVPTAVVASNDQADPEHPQRVGEAYAAMIKGARLVLDQPGHSPVAWQGSRLSAIIAQVAAAAGSRSAPVVRSAEANPDRLG